MVFTKNGTNGWGGGRHGLEEERSHDARAARVRIPPILTLLIFSDFEEQLEKSIAIAKVRMKGRNRGSVSEGKRRDDDVIRTKTEAEFGSEFVIEKLL